MTVERKPRVAVLINDMHAAGGIQRVASNLVRILGPRYEVRLVSVEPLRNPVFQDAGLNFQSLEKVRGNGGRLRYVWELAAVGRKLRAYVREHRIDVVLVIWYDWSCVAAWALPRTVVKVGCEHIAFDEAPRFWRLMRHLSYRRLDAVVGLTQADFPRLSRISRKAVVIPNAVEIPPANAAGKREKILLCVGHLIVRKGLDRLLWSLQKPLHEHPDWKLVFLGGGEFGHSDWGYLQYLSALIQLLQLEKQVVLLPATRKIRSWYDRASIYVMGSRQEGLPMVLIEAKVHGLPIVSFDCPTGPREIVRHEIDGFLVREDHEAFGEAASALMTDSALRERMSSAAIDSVRRHFSMESITKQWMDLIASLTARSGSSI